MKFSVILLALLFSFGFALAQDIACHCQDGEETVINFKLKKNDKVLSICEGPDQSYLQYRFGHPGKVELAFPAKMDASSYAQFDFSYYNRGGGAMNAGMGLHNLKFSKGDVSYEVYDDWAYEDETEESYTASIGVIVIVGEKSYDLEGDKEGQTGGLFNLEDHDQIPNSSDE